MMISDEIKRTQQKHLEYPIDTHRIYNVCLLCSYNALSLSNFSLRASKI